MNKIKYIAPLLIAIAALGFQQAKADSTTYTLGTPNSAISPFPAPYGTVTVTLTSATTANVTFTAGSSGGFSYLFVDGSAAAVNVNAGSWTITNLASTTPATGGFVAQPAGFPADGGSGTVDGFGVLNQTVNGFDSTDHAMSSISFTLTNTSGTWASAASVLIANSQGVLVAAHIVVFASGSVINGTQLATGFVANGGASVPDGGTTVMLLGMAFGALGMVRRFLRS
jgi:protein with PEP-CTERM/exosortase system signal